MRIQHNIMAMSAYRNYTNNVSAMKKNLEKLSSGYKINRAGDDAAGLAISEKMRAQITGLETAQKNAKDGISLVQTAEGALTEVHDMLNRMVELATQSANGTYSDETDREQLQKEVVQLQSEINRIADSSNFNGLKLLDGSMSAVGTVTTPANAGSTVKVSGDVSFTVGGSTAISMSSSAIASAAAKASGTTATISGGKIALGAAGSTLGTNTIAHTTTTAAASKTRFSIDLHDVSFDNGKGNKLTITIGSGSQAGVIELEGKGTGALSGASLVSALKDAASKAGLTINGQEFKVVATTGAGDGRITFEQASAVKTESDIVRGDMAVTIAGASVAGAGFASGAATAANVKVTMPAASASTKELKWDNATDKIGSAGLAQLQGRVFTVQLADRTISVTIGASDSAAAADHMTVKATASMTMDDIAGKITDALASAATVRATLAANANASIIGPGYSAGDKIFVATAATFAIDANGSISVTTLTGKQYTVTADGTVGAAGAAAAAADFNAKFTYSNDAAVEVPKSFDWKTTNTAVQDTSMLEGEEVTVEIEGKTYTVKLAAATDATATGSNVVKLNTGGEKSADLLNKIVANLNKQVTADNAAGAAGSANYNQITNIQASVTASGVVNITASKTPMTLPTGSDSVTAKHFNTQTTDPITASLGGTKKASTQFTATADMFTDGGTISFGSSTYTFVMSGTSVSGAGKVDLRDLVGSDGKIIASKVGEAAQRLADAAGSNAVWTVGASKGKLTFVEIGSAAASMTTASKVAADFKLTLAPKSQDGVGKTDEVVTKYGGAAVKDDDGKVTDRKGDSLTLQIGDTADDFNQLKVDIADCHANAMGITEDVTITLKDGTTKTIKAVVDGKSIQDIDLSTQSKAKEAVDVIKAAINYVSDVRGGLGATQNRLDHTINNLSVMTENIQDAESTIRDVDVAEEMMAYTKNNILIQSAQAMLAQANQVPQGVLQLLQ